MPELVSTEYPEGSVNIGSRNALPQTPSEVSMAVNISTKYSVPVENVYVPFTSNGTEFRVVSDVQLKLTSDPVMDRLELPDDVAKLSPAMYPLASIFTETDGVGPRNSTK